MMAVTNSHVKCSVAVVILQVQYSAMLTQVLKSGYLFIFTRHMQRTFPFVSLHDNIVSHVHKTLQQIHKSKL